MFELAKRCALKSKYNNDSSNTKTETVAPLPPVIFSVAKRMAREKIKINIKHNPREASTPEPHTLTPNAPQKIKITLKCQPEKISSDIWSEKYRPVKLDGLVGNTESIMVIRDWFTKFKNKDTSIKKALLFTGCPGTSKTTVAHVILKEFGYDIKEYNASDVRSKKLVKENLDKLITMEQVDRQFRENFKPFGIIMDEVDGMSSGDKGGMSELIKTINPNRGKRCVKKSDKQKIIERWIPPIICICNNNYNKKIKELKKDCLEVRFNKPTIWELCTVIRKTTASENIEFTENAEKLVAELSQGDFRRLMFLLQNFSNIKKKPIDVNDIYEYYDVVSKKTLDLNSFDITDKIFQHQTNIEDVLKLYDTDKSKLPMMIHENYVTCVNSQNTIIHNKLKCSLSCINAIIDADVIEKSMYNTQSWYLQPIHGLCSCYIPNHYSNIYPKLGQNRPKWTTALGNYSQRRHLVKNINFLSEILNNGRSYNVYDIQMLSHIILYNLLDPKGDQNTGIKYMKNYNLTIKNIEKLIKADKSCDEYRKLYTARQKNNLTELFGCHTQKEPYQLKYNTKSSKEKTIHITATSSAKKIIDDDEDEIDSKVIDEIEDESSDDDET